MPYKSAAQRRFFHSPGAAKAGIKPATVKEFDKESKGLTDFKLADKNKLPAMPQQPDPDEVINPDKKFKMLRSKLKGY